MNSVGAQNFFQSKKYKATIDSLSNGSTRKNLNANQFGELEIPMYSSDMQQHIVNTQRRTQYAS